MAINNLQQQQQQNKDEMLNNSNSSDYLSLISFSLFWLPHIS